jgi:hypothetical protein
MERARVCVCACMRVSGCTRGHTVALQYAAKWCDRADDGDAILDDPTGGLDVDVLAAPVTSAAAVTTVVAESARRDSLVSEAPRQRQLSRLQVACVVWW